MKSKYLIIIYFLIIKGNLLLAQCSIKMDGFFDDWNSNYIAHIDDSLDSQSVDLLDFKVCNDNNYLYIKIRVDSEIDLTEWFYNPAKIIINIDSDNDVSTGFPVNNIGSEYGINFFDKFIFDDSNNSLVDTLSLYSLEVMPLPTISSNEFEIAINKSLFADTISISIRELIGNDFMPDNGEIFTYIFGNNFNTSQPIINFEKNDSSFLRIMTYNVWSNGLKNNNRIEEHRRIFNSVNADIITYQECGNTSYNDVVNFLDTNYTHYPYIYPDLNSGNLTISKYPSVQSWQVANKIDAELIDLPDSIYLTDILIVNAHPPCCNNNQGRQEHFDAFIEFIHDAKTIGGLIDLPLNTPISFSGDMNLVGYSEQYQTIINGTISDTATYGVGGLPDWDSTTLMDQICYINETNLGYTWDKSNPNVGDFPPGRLDFIFYTNSVLTADQGFVVSTEHMNASSLTQNNLIWDDTKNASDHFPVVVDFMPQLQIFGCTDTLACNYNATATIDNNNCFYITNSFDTIITNSTILWNGIPLTSSGDYSHALISSTGCDSIANLNLTINTLSSNHYITNKTRRLIKTINMIGETINYQKNALLIYIYDDGTVVKKVFLE